ncbi:tripartite tricarboxylate transporter substrate binding protein [Hydrogenophaga sp. YM1]|uniref:Bug family tripartite tricarboxylate transporter substrate binding protein n=1 Tax=Hydrogenophaga sp. YM1 TaxID=2806262 RepID=UPI00195D1059|nr:tripartite tricarboxylate transporter substrate binding protein [Hydrogenophaga sp. YM1]QRR33989.1 tripartite tricarboxylate transporter substrate binding protein [Hydrogenophaga sp. YM1]
MAIYKNQRSQLIVLLGAAAFSLSSFAQTGFPSKPVTLIVPYGAGGSADVMARSLGDKLSKAWNVPVVVENRSGANGIVATQALMKAPADGHTILMHLTGVIQNASLYKKLPYDPFADIVPVTQIGTQPMGLAVGSKSPYKNVQSLVQALSSDPSRGSYGSFGTGSTGHIFGELLRSAARSEMPHVPYRGEAPMIPEIMTGRVDVGFVSTATAAERGNDGTLRILAVTGSKRQPTLPSVPTMDEAGLKGFDIVGWYGLFVPKGTPAKTVERIAEDTKAALARPEMVYRFKQLAIEPTGTTPKQFETIMREDFRRWDALIKRFNITNE